MLYHRERAGQKIDLKRKPENRYSELLFGLVYQQNKRGVSLCEKSHELPSD